MSRDIKTPPVSIGRIEAELAICNVDFEKKRDWEWEKTYLLAKQPRKRNRHYNEANGAIKPGIKYNVREMRQYRYEREVSPV